MCTRVERNDCESLSSKAAQAHYKKVVPGGQIRQETGRQNWTKNKTTNLDEKREEKLDDTLDDKLDDNTRPVWLQLNAMYLYVHLDVFCSFSVHWLIGCQTTYHHCIKS